MKHTSLFSLYKASFHGLGKSLVTSIATKAKSTCRGGREDKRSYPQEVLEKAAVFSKNSVNNGSWGYCLLRTSYFSSHLSLSVIKIPCAGDDTVLKYQEITVRPKEVTARLHSFFHKLNWKTGTYSLWDPAEAQPLNLLCGVHWLPELLQDLGFHLV